jgi:nitric oxide reductase NorD protein
VLHWAGVTSKSSPELAYQFAALASQAVAELGFAGAERWLLAAMDVHDREGLYRASAELKDLATYVAGSRERGRGVELEEVAGVLERFAAGLAGRRLRLEVAEIPWTDTATLYLPARIALLPSRAENFRLYKVTAALLWAQTRYGTFNLDEAAYPRGARPLALFVALECLRLGARLERQLPGLHRDLQALALPALGADWAHAAVRLRRSRASAADSAALAESLAASL